MKVLHLTRGSAFRGVGHHDVPMTNHTAPANPVVRTTALIAYPGWTVREYADGMFDAAHVRVGLTRGHDTFGAVVADVREMERGA